MSPISSSSPESGPISRPEPVSPAPSSPSPEAPSPVSAPAAPEPARDRSEVTPTEPAESGGVQNMVAGLQGNFAAPPAQSLEVDMLRHTEARLAHTSAQINNPNVSGAERRQLLREQAELRSQRDRLQLEPGAGPAVPPLGEQLGQGLDAVRSVTGDRWHVGTAQRVREAYNDPNLSSRERGGRIGGEVGGAAGNTVGSRLGMVRGAATGARLGLSGGSAAGFALGGPPGAFAGGLLGIAGGTIIGGAAGWWLGGAAGNAVGGAAGRPVGNAIGGLAGS